MKKFFARFAHAFMESRQRQADRVIRDHYHLLPVSEIRRAAENMNTSKPTNIVSLPSMAPAELSLAA